MAIASALPPPADASAGTFRLAAVGDHYHAAVLARNRASIPFLVDTGATFTPLSPQTLGALGFAAPPHARPVTLETADRRRVQGRQFVLPELRVGPYLLGDVPVVVCEDCTSLLGQTTLARFDLSTQTREGVEFLDLKLRR